MLKIAMIGLDTSHVEIFADLLTNPSNPHHVQGVSIVSAFPAGSVDFPLSSGRVDGYTSLLKNRYGVNITDTPEKAAEGCDAVWITAVDGRKHEELLRAVVSPGKPVFIDKPFSSDYESALRMIQLAEAENIPLMSSSSLRFSEEFRALIYSRSDPHVRVECSGPLSFQPQLPGYFWYGIHTAEMLYAALGKGCRSVKTSAGERAEVTECEWEGGRTGVLTGCLQEEADFKAVLYSSANHSQAVNLSRCEKPYYASLAEKAVEFSSTGKAEPELEETLELIRFLEAVNESRSRDGEKIFL